MVHGMVGSRINGDQVEDKYRQKSILKSTLKIFKFCVFPKKLQDISVLDSISPWQPTQCYSFLMKQFERNDLILYDSTTYENNNN